MTRNAFKQGGNSLLKLFITRNRGLQAIIDEDKEEKNTYLK